MSAIINNQDIANNNNNNNNEELKPDLSTTNEIATLSMKMKMNNIENQRNKEDEANGEVNNSTDDNNSGNKSDDVTIATYHDLGKLTLESIPKRFKLYELLVKDHPTKVGKNASTNERLGKSFS